MPDFEVIDTINLECAKMELRSDGIVRTQIKENFDLEITHAHQLMEAYLKIGDGKKYPHLFVFKSMSLANRDVLVYMANEANDYGVADAILIDSKAQKILANFYILVQQPKIPTKFFRIEHEAIQWLRTFVQ